MSVNLQRSHRLGAQTTLDVRSPEERLASAVQRLERITDWFDRALPNPQR